MFKKANKVLSVVFIFIFVVSMMVHPLNAMSYDEHITREVGGVEPRWANVISTSLILNLNEPTIQLSITMGGRSGTTYNHGTVVLEKISGSNCGIVQTWSDLSSNSAVFQFKDSTITRTSGTYCMTITINAVRNGVSETITASKESTY